jgi:PTS system mannitol-specific IIC component
MKEFIQRVGGAASGMVIPNIGAFIAWGLITSLYIGPGWAPNEDLVSLVDPMIFYLLPLLIGYTGGKMIYGHRGGVIGAVVTTAAVVGTSSPQFLGAMLVGPGAAKVLKELDARLRDNVPEGFEMLYDNFSSGILGWGLAVFVYSFLANILQAIADGLGNFAAGIVDAGLVPLADIPIEVAKVLFLNNAVNHGVLTPLGAAQAAEEGKSIYYMLESNPGPGLGLLIAYYIAGTGMWKQSAPGSIIIHFFGGIHEIYFPYVLGHPIMIVAMWAGGISADLWWVATDAGLVGPPSPGSIFAYLAMLPRSGGANVLIGVAIGAVAAAVVGTILLRVRPIQEKDAGVEDAIDTSIPGVDV